MIVAKVVAIAALVFWVCVCAYWIRRVRRESRPPEETPPPFGTVTIHPGPNGKMIEYVGDKAARDLAEKLSLDDARWLSAHGATWLYVAPEERVERDEAGRETYTIVDARGRVTVVYRGVASPCVEPPRAATWDRPLALKTLADYASLATEGPNEPDNHERPRP